MTQQSGTVSVIIPVLNEAANIVACLDELKKAGAGNIAEVLLVDGAPDADTLAALPGTASARGIRSEPGRARQMNRGARDASGAILLFLHADTRLPPRALEAVLQAVRSGAACGAFRLRIDSPAHWARFLSLAANLRTRITRAPYGDQALFFTRAAFDDLGGFADLELMEDVDIMTRARRARLPLKLLSLAARTSPRRWETEGPFRRTLKNLLLRLLYHLGIPPSRLVRLYRPWKQSP